MDRRYWHLTLGGKYGPRNVLTLSQPWHHADLSAPPPFHSALLYGALGVSDKWSEYDPEIHAWGKEYERDIRKKRFSKDARWTLGKTIRFRVTCYSDGFGKYHHLVISPSGHLSCVDHDVPGFRGCITEFDRLVQLKREYVFNHGTEEQQAADPVGLKDSTGAIRARERYESRVRGVKSRKWKPKHEEMSEACGGGKNRCREVQRNWLAFLQKKAELDYNRWSHTKKRLYDNLHPILQKVAMGRVALALERARWNRSVGGTHAAEGELYTTGPFKGRLRTLSNSGHQHGIPHTLWIQTPTTSGHEYVSNLRPGFRHTCKKERKKRLRKQVERNLNRIFRGVVGDIYERKYIPINFTDWFHDVAMKGLDFPFRAHTDHLFPDDSSDHGVLFHGIVASVCRRPASPGSSYDRVVATILICPNEDFSKRRPFVHTARVIWQETKDEDTGFFYFFIPKDVLSKRTLRNRSSEYVQKYGDFIFASTDEHTRKDIGPPGGFKGEKHMIPAAIGRQLSYIEFGTTHGNTPTVLQPPENWIYRRTP